MKTSYSLLAFLTATAAAGAAMAEPSFGPIRPYVGVEYNYIGADVSSYAEDVNGNGIADYSGKPFADRYHSLVPNVGVRIGRHFGLEAGYLRTSREEQSLTGTDFLAGLTGEVETRITGWHVDVNGYLPLADRLEAIGSVGVGRYKAESDLTLMAGGAPLGAGASFDDSDTALRLGAGLQYGLNDHVSLRGMVRYIDATFDSGGFTAADGAWTGALGVSYTF